MSSDPYSAYMNECKFNECRSHTPGQNKTGVNGSKHRNTVQTGIQGKKGTLDLN